MPWRVLADTLPAHFLGSGRHDLMAIINTSGPLGARGRCKCARSERRACIHHAVMMQCDASCSGMKESSQTEHIEWTEKESRLHAMVNPVAAVERVAPVNGMPLLETQGLTRHFKVCGPFSRKVLHAVDDVDLVIYPGQIVALVGESGSGKSTVARLIARIYPPTHGSVQLSGRSMETLSLRSYRKQVQMVFQDPHSSLNPIFRASHGMMRCLKLHRGMRGKRSRERAAIEIMESVGLHPAEELIRKYPHELSGGQRQRFGFAQALACDPVLILADEPVSMLDVSIRLGVLNLMAGLRTNHGVSFLYITHDIASARYIADRILVMYAGRIVEQGPAETVLQNPRHPYTQLLLSAVPDPYAADEPTQPADASEPPRVINPGHGCRFRWRCPLVISTCEAVTPELRSVGRAHAGACHVTAG
jgi:peptide/nickel transport system ATP-binding protein